MDGKSPANVLTLETATPPAATRGVCQANRRGTTPTTQLQFTIAKTPPQSPQCAFCAEPGTIYHFGESYICDFHLASAVSMVANDTWPGAVSYTREVEDFLW